MQLTTTWCKTKTPGFRSNSTSAHCPICIKSISRLNQEYEHWFHSLFLGRGEHWRTEFQNICLHPHQVYPDNGHLSLQQILKWSDDLYSQIYLFLVSYMLINWGKGFLQTIKRPELVRTQTLQLTLTISLWAWKFTFLYIN